MNALTPTTQGFALVPTNMDDAIRLAKAMASAKLVPKHLHDDVGSCLMIVEQALRWNMSPFAVAQCTSSISGKLMFEGKLVAAAVESSGAIEGHFDYTYSGEGDDRAVTVSARRVGEQNPRQLTVKLRDVRTTNEWWKRQPDQQLAYSGVRNWARRFTPAAMLGVYVPEEIDRSTGRTIEGDPVVERPPKREDGSPHPKMTMREFLESAELALKDATSGSEIDILLNSPRMKQAQEHAKGESADRLQKIISEAELRRATLDEKEEDGIPFP